MGRTDADTVGFHQAYLILGCITLSFTVISLFTLKGKNPCSRPQHNARPPETSGGASAIHR
ncbi:MAG: MFS transporter [Enterobacteriaceae bacterium]